MVHRETKLKESTRPEHVEQGACTIRLNDEEHVLGVCTVLSEDEQRKVEAKACVPSSDSNDLSFDLDQEGSSTSDPLTSAVQKPELTRQSNVATIHPGAVRMCGASPVIGDDEQSSVHNEQEMHQDPEISPSILVNAELVRDDQDDGDIEAGRRTREADTEIASAALFEDKQILVHLLRQRRVQLALLVLVLVFVALTVGMVLGLSSNREQTVFLVSNGTTTSLDDDNVTSSHPKET